MEYKYNNLKEKYLNEVLTNVQLKEQTKMLQQRISKAIEYIEFVRIDDAYCNVLLEILKGDSNE